MKRIATFEPLQKVQRVDNSEVGYIVSHAYTILDREVYEVLFFTQRPRLYPKLEGNERVYFLESTKLRRTENDL